MTVIRWQRVETKNGGFMKTGIVSLLIYLFVSTLYAQLTQQGGTTVTLPCIIIHTSEIGKNDLQLIRTESNTTIPIESLSRQFLKPGSYILSFEQWGYYKYKKSFDLQDGDVKEFTLTLKPIDGDLISNYNQAKKMKNISIFTSTVAISAAVYCKIMGDKAYDKYNGSTVESDLSQYRNSSNTYQFALLASSTLGVGSVATWIMTHIIGRNEKNKIINEMDRQMP